MIIRLDAVQIFVSDIKNAEKWYSKIFKMKLIEADYKLKYLVMKLGKNIFYIETPNPLWGEGWDKVKIGGRTSIVFKTKNIYETIIILKQKGVRIVEGVYKRPWGEYKAVFADTDGNEFNLVQG